MSDPWFKFYPSDWLSGTRGLTAAETGIYITLIAMMYEGGEPIHMDDARLSRLCGCPTGVFKKCLEGLMATRKIVRKDGGLWNDRVEKERYSRDVASQNASDAAKERWRLQQEKDQQNQSPPHATASVPQCDPHPIPEARSQNKKHTVETASPAFDAFWEVWPKKVEKKAARLKFDRAIKSGVDPGRIIDAAKAYASTDGVKRGFVKNPDAWLGNERWNDEIQPASQQKSPTDPPRNDFWRRVASQ